MPSTIWRFDADSTGVDSISSYIKSKRIINVPCPTFLAFDEAARTLQDTIKPGDAVIFDTLSSLLETTRGDMMLGNNPAQSLWEQHIKFFGDKQFMNTYRGAQSLTLRRIKNLAARGAYCIVVCHEAEGKDPREGLVMGVPQVNPAMVDDLIATCSDVFRMEELTQDRVNNEGKVILHKGDHVLYLRRTGEFTAKFHVDRNLVEPKSIPGGLVEPSMTKLADTLHKIPSCLCVYGYPGVGKTTFAASIADLLDRSVAKEKTA